MARSYIIAGIDIGNAFVKTVIASLDKDSGRPRILGIGSFPSNGMRRGVVFDMEETINDIGQSVSRAQAMADVKIKRAYVSINGLHIRSQTSRGVVAVSRADNETSQNDMDRLIDAASTISLPQNREIIHIIPKLFIIDGQEYVKNPLGMKGVRLEAEVLIIDGLSPYIQNLAKCVNANDVEVIEFVFSPLALSKAILGKHQKEHGVASIDFGGGLSTLAVFHEGEILNTAVLPLGSRHITNDLAVALRTSIESAEQIKLDYGFVNIEANEKGELDLSEVVDEADFIIPKKNLGKIIQARVEEVLDIVQTELKKIPPTILLAGGIVLAGGGSNLDGFPLFVKDRLRLPVKSAALSNFGGIADQMADPSFYVAAGLVLWGIEKEYSDFKPHKGFNFGNNRLFKKIANWAKNFLP